jgi:hypothetical protein
MRDSGKDDQMEGRRERGDTNISLVYAAPGVTQ